MIGKHIAKTNTHKFVGKCIYCGATDNLHDEHVIPESLNGVRILDKASCGDCGRITSRFEGNYARDSMLPVRTAWNMKSKRSKKKRPTAFPMKFIKNGVEKIIDVPVEDHWSIIPLMEIGPPGKYPNLDHGRGLKHGEYEIRGFKIRPDEHIEYLKQKYDADEIGVASYIEPLSFLRMIAKIGYCTAVWKYGLQNIVPFVVPAILGQSDDILHWVGSEGKQSVYQTSRDMDTDHVVMTSQLPDGEVLARVKLFSKSLVPEYLVVVGRLTDQAHGLYQSLGYN
jgi:hypothetical protein